MKSASPTSMDNRDRVLPAMLIAGLAFALGYIAAAKVDSHIDKDGWDIATAIGTVSAVVVALWFGLRGEWRQSVDRREHALLNAVYYSVPLGQLKTQAKYMRDSLRALRDWHGLPDGFLNSTVFNCLKNPLINEQPDRWLPIYALNSNAALQLSAAMSVLIRCRSVYLDAQERWPTLDDEGKATYVTLNRPGILGGQLV